MSLLKSPPEIADAAIPFKVRLEPYLIETICELARLLRDKPDQQSDVSGLLFGKIGTGLRTVEALKTFVEAGLHSDLARRERLDQAYKTGVADAKNDPELSAFDVVGWFSFRSGSGLLSGDVAFHNQQFRKQDDIALVVSRDGPSQITAEVYAKPEQDSLTAEDYRWGSFRLSADIRHMRESIEIAMRVKLGDDSYLRAYDSGEPESAISGLIRKAEFASDKIFSLFSRSKDEPNTANVRGLISDGRLPSRSSWPPEAAESAIHPQAYFNPYAESAKAMSQRASAADSPAPTPAPPPAAPVPAKPLAASATSPPRPAHYTPEIRASVSRPQLALPAAPLLDLGNLGQSPRSRRAAPGEISGLPMLLRAPKKDTPWPWAAALFAVCSALVFGVLAFGGLQNDGGRFGQAFHAMFPGGELNLRVRTEDDRLRLTWNQRNRAVSASTGGTLQIFDGQQHREIHLEGRQVADGSVLYRPNTNDVTFRLEIRGEQGAASGSVRVLDGLSSQQQPSLDVSAPRSTPTSGQLSATQPSAALVNEPRLLSNSSSQDPGAPSLIRPETGAEYVRPDNRSQASGGQYGTPSNIGSFPAATDGSTINSWDTPSPRLRPKQRNTRPYKPVFPTAGFVAPRPLMQVMPRTSSIPNGTILSRTRVQVQVRVDPAGKVEAARLVGSPVNETIASAALAAARQWTFEPASNNGNRVVSDHTIVFEFRPER